jgi:hypothetical protein
VPAVLVDLQPPIGRLSARRCALLHRDRAVETPVEERRVDCVQPQFWGGRPSSRRRPRPGPCRRPTPRTGSPRTRTASSGRTCRPCGRPAPTTSRPPPALRGASQRGARQRRGRRGAHRKETRVHQRRRDHCGPRRPALGEDGDGRELRRAGEHQCRHRDDREGGQPRILRHDAEFRPRSRPASRPPSSAQHEEATMTTSRPSPPPGCSAPTESTANSASCTPSASRASRRSRSSTSSPTRSAKAATSNSAASRTASEASKKPKQSPPTTPHWPSTSGGRRCPTSGGSWKLTHERAHPSQLEQSLLAGATFRARASLGRPPTRSPSTPTCPASSTAQTRRRHAAPAAAQ